MNLDELQSVQARERQSSDLQHLRSSFYREVGEFIRELTEERARVVKRADDPFSSPEVRRLSDDIETAEQTVEAIYERRVGKVVKKASIAAAGMPVDDDGLTEEEAALFDDLVARIERNRDAVLSAMDGEGPSVSCSIDEGATASDPRSTADTAGHGDPADSAAPEPDGVSAADLMGEGPPEEAPTTSDEVSPAGSPAESPAPGPAVEEAPPDVGGRSAVETGSSPEDSGGPTEQSTAQPAPVDHEESRTADGTAGSGADLPGVPRTTVRITADVGEVVGADDRDYDLGSEDVVRLPESNAEVLVEKDAAERLE